MRWLLIFCIAFATSCQTSEKRISQKQIQKIEVQGHRGARGRLPENSLEGLKYALELGVEVLEFDLGVTKDKVVVLAHDPYIQTDLCVDKENQPLRKKIYFNTLTLQEVKTYTCGTRPHSRFPQQQQVAVKIPTLDEVFEMIKSSKHPNAKTVRFNIETKITPDEPEHFSTPREFAELVLASVKKHKMLSRTVLQSFDHRTLVEARKLEPKIVLSPLLDSKRNDIVQITQELGAEIISPRHTWLTAQMVADLHAANKLVIPWTANKPSEWERLVELNVDGIITDYPEELITWLKSKNLR